LVSATKEAAMAERRPPAQLTLKNGRIWPERPVSK
jgi:hypothetical protein